VLESAVVGMPHPDFGEVGCAFVLAKPGAVLDPAALLLALKGQLAGFKVPKLCKLLDELPRNAMGKVQKNVLRQLLGSDSNNTNNWGQIPITQNNWNLTPINRPKPSRWPHPIQ
jgi:acyl-CoA synthetase (AMP-forming)/AMP-acid ligase II